VAAPSNAVVPPRRENIAIRSTAIALRVLALGLGVFFIAMSVNKIAWLTNADLLSDRFVRWAPAASPGVRWYLDIIALPLAPVLARAIPISEFCIGLSFVVGLWMRPAALLALFLVLNFHFGTSALYTWEFLRDATGPPVLAALIALLIGARSLPLTIDVAASQRRGCDGAGGSGEAAG
jgi:uncharacterized membrane protein YphA (DoxX/SURF4 family)